MHIQYLKFENISKSAITPTIIDEFIHLVSQDSRVSTLGFQGLKEGTPLFTIEALELKGIFSLGRIAGHLKELPSEQKTRLAPELRPLPDIITIQSPHLDPSFSLYTSGLLPPFTRSCLIKHAQTLPPSTDRALCLSIRSLKLALGETIAHRLMREHPSLSGAHRAARLMVEAGCANEINRKQSMIGTFEFEDGSQLNSRDVFQ